MPASYITYDTELLLDRKVGAAGMPELDLPRLSGRLEAAKAAILRAAKSGEIGFFSIPDRAVEARAAEKLARETSRKHKTLIVCGIGGSDLGARALIKALAVPGKGMDVRFVGANTDPEELMALLASVDLRRSVINVISKSGDTIETMSAFLILRDALIKKVGMRHHGAHIIATTDEHSGTLREIAQREGYRMLPVPKDIGGRFSALTPVGLFPAACAGIPVAKLLAGAAAARGAFVRESASANAAALFAGLHVEGYEKRGQHVTVLMPYAESLREFAFWFRQLWAESLGKARHRDGSDAGVGLTPIAALGATDQHSQIQLYMEGPADKIVTFIEVAKFRKDVTVPRAFRDLPAVAWFGGKKLSQIIHVEREATARALAGAGRASGTLRIPSVSAESMGALMMHFMLATAMAAELLDIDAYDQPGVQEGKRLITQILA